MSLFKKLLGTSSDPTPAQGEAMAPAQAPQGFPLSGDEIDQWRSVVADIGFPGAGELLPCEGIDWNEAEQLRFLAEAMPRWRGETDRIAAEHGDDPWLRGQSAAVLYAMVSEMEPTRIMEVGCGRTTVQIRRAMKARAMPAELIAVDPEPRAHIGEHVDAHLAQPVQELPLDDFDMLRGNEMLVVDTTHVLLPGGEVEYLHRRVLPRLNPGVVVGINGIALPRHYGEEELRRGFGEQTLLQAFLTNNDRVEILHAGAWLREHHGSALREAMPQADEGDPSTWMWWRVKG